MPITFGAGVPARQLRPHVLLVGLLRFHLPPGDIEFQSGSERPHTRSKPWYDAAFRSVEP
jgi:hypothetical protein